jgi:hypothetical protein
MGVLPLLGQVKQPSPQLAIGTKKTVVDQTFGAPFEHWKLQPSEDSAKVGAPLGEWSVYHLTTAGDRMYVTMLHFASTSNEAKPAIDALMLMPNGHWTVEQILQDQPEFSALCSQGCDVERIVNGFGNASLLLVPRETVASKSVLYFEGDAAILKWKSVSGLQSIVSWVYAVPRTDFERQHKDLKSEVLGSWSPKGINLQ